MSHYATKTDDAVTPAQEHAIQALISGETITSAAKAANVSRQTVHRWLRQDFKFQAKLNAARADLRQESEDRLFGLAAEAIRVVDLALQEGDATVGLSIRRGLGLLDGKPQELDSQSMAAIRSKAANRKLMESISLS
jgi:transposase-like protein